MNKKHPNHDSPEKGMQVWSQAINTHGIFFKKAVREKIEQYQDDDIKILDEGKAGLFGMMGSTPARIKIVPKDNKGIIDWKEAEARAKEMALKIARSIDPKTNVGVEKDSDGLYINVTGGNYDN